LSQKRRRTRLDSLWRRTLHIAADAHRQRHTQQHHHARSSSTHASETVCAGAGPSCQVVPGSIHTHTHTHRARQSIRKPVGALAATSLQQGSRGRADWRADSGTAWQRVQHTSAPDTIPCAAAGALAGPSWALGWPTWSPLQPDQGCWASGRHENPAVLLARSTLDLYQVRRQSVTVDRKDARNCKDPPAKIQPATNPSTNLV
jgi:hypothetical protein